MGESGADPKARRNRRIIWGAAILLAVAALTAVALYVTGEPWFCATCHEMQPTVAGWRQGTHAKFSCFACHSEPGPVGYLKAHVGDGLRDVYVHFTRRPERVQTSNVPPRRCLRCHDKDFGTDKLPPDHPAKTADCGECHRDSIHGQR